MPLLVSKNIDIFEFWRQKVLWNWFQNRASFGKSQLLNGLTLANQNKNKMARKFKDLQVFLEVKAE